MINLIMWQVSTTWRKSSIFLARLTLPRWRCSGSLTRTRPTRTPTFWWPRSIWGTMTSKGPTSHSSMVSAITFRSRTIRRIIWSGPGFTSSRTIWSRLWRLCSRPCNCRVSKKNVRTLNTSFVAEMNQMISFGNKKIKSDFFDKSNFHLFYFVYPVKTRT